MIVRVKQADAVGGRRSGLIDRLITWTGKVGVCAPASSGSPTTTTGADRVAAVRALMAVSGVSAMFAGASRPRLKRTAHAFAVVYADYAVTVFVGIHLDDVFARLVEDIDHAAVAVR